MVLSPMTPTLSNKRVLVTGAAGFLGAAVRPMDLTRSLGLCCMLLGVWLVVK